MRRRSVLAAMAVGVAVMADKRIGTKAAPGTATPQAGGMLEMVLTREFEAPVARVWQAWTTAEDVKRWWGPEGFTAPVAEMDVQIGGTSLVCMRSPDGQDFYNTWTYTVIEPNQRLEFVHHFADAQGNPISPADAGLPPEIPSEVPHIITFKPLDGDRTELTVVEQGYRDAWVVEMSKAGMEQVLEKMAVVVE
jgi:uncharacterized protein YndB with AHSA1/START domain